jgi:hypothetical protein
MSSKKSESVVAIPRWALGALAALIVLPWLVTWGRMAWSSPAPESELVAEGTPTPAAYGPWGSLTLSPIVISPPLEYVAADMGPIATPEWQFPQMSREMVASSLAGVGLSDDQVRQAIAASRPDARIAGTIVRPDAALVRKLSPEARERLYVTLAQSPLNFDQQQAYRFRGASADEWLRGSSISAETRQLVAPLVYRSGPFVHFADMETVRQQIDDTEQLQLLVKTLVRQATMLVRLQVEDVEDIDELAEYWGRGGRRMDIRPLLESVAGGGTDRFIDIVHLLPTMARNSLFRYPRPTTADLQRPILANCLWTALNFFGLEPDDRFLDVETALKALETEYYNVEHGYRLGDIVAFIDEDGDLFHVAVYLAEDLVFSKNGMSPMAPWVILELEDVKGYYLTHSTNPKLIFHRRNDL